MRLLHLAARHGRVCLILGLLAGLAFPALAAVVRPWLPELVGLLIAIAAARIGPRAIAGNLSTARRSLVFALVYQLAMPLAAIGVFAATGLLGSPLALAIVLMLAAPSITGSPNFTAMIGHDPAPAMRLMILGTALFPVTMLPVLMLLPGMSGAAEVVVAALRVLGIILLAVAAGTVVRRIAPGGGQERLLAFDGASAILLAILVVGLMEALGPAILTEPRVALGWFVLAVAANFTLQVAAYRLTGEAGLSIIAGNRNISLFLVALPAAQMDPVLIFIGCYQIPMYLTPILSRFLFAGRGRG